MKSSQVIAKKLQELMEDERLKAPPAQVGINAPLALIQVDLGATVAALKWVLTDEPNDVVLIPLITIVTEAEKIYDLAREDTTVHALLTMVSREELNFEQAMMSGVFILSEMNKELRQGSFDYFLKHRPVLIEKPAVDLASLISDLQGVFADNDGDAEERLDNVIAELEIIRNRSSKTGS